MKQSGAFFPGVAADIAVPGEIEVTSPSLTLALADDPSYLELGYNPYDTIAAQDALRRDVWRNKRKRA